MAVLLLAGCSSTKEVAVPNLFGMTEQEARDALGKDGLELVWVVYQNGVQTTVQKGRVLNQTPAAATTVEEGAAVDIVLAGDAGVPTPDVVGKTQGDAITEIQAAGLRVGKIEQVADAKIPVGQVIAQTPLPKEIAALGAGVDLKLSMGQPVTTVPDVVGKTKARRRESPQRRRVQDHGDRRVQRHALRTGGEPGPGRGRRAEYRRGRHSERLERPAIGSDGAGHRGQERGGRNQAC